MCVDEAGQDPRAPKVRRGSFGGLAFGNDPLDAAPGEQQAAPPKDGLPGHRSRHCEEGFSTSAIGKRKEAPIPRAPVSHSSVNAVRYTACLSNSSPNPLTSRSLDQSI